MDDCLGNGDIDYASKLTQSVSASFVDGSPISTPVGINKKKLRIRTERLINSTSLKLCVDLDEIIAEFKIDT